MTIADLTAKVNKLAQAKGGLGSSIKFSTDEGVIFLTADGQVSNDDQAADCAISVKIADLLALMSGDLNPMSAVMFGKIKISGDMSVAMKLKELF